MALPSHICNRRTIHSIIHSSKSISLTTFVTHMKLHLSLIMMNQLTTCNCKNDSHVHLLRTTPADEVLSLMAGYVG